MEVKQLRSQRPRAWSAILAQEPEMSGIVVTQVSRQRLSPRLTRFTLELADHTEPISLIGKETNETEALFYQTLSSRLPYLVPRCWFSHRQKEKSWVVLDDVTTTRPPQRWTMGDVEAVVQGLASLHVEFWDREDLLDECTWLAKPLEGVALDQRYVLRHQVFEQGTFYAQLGTGVTLSDHAIWSLGRLAPRFLHAAAAVTFLQQRGGWPGVFERADLDAAADLLDDPVPMLYTLRDQPLTLQHGAPLNHHWHMTLFGTARLFDWHQVSAGPGITDLVHLVEQFNWLRDASDQFSLRPQEIVTDETLIDSYILHLAAELGPLCDTRAVRQSIAAARCFYLLAYWLPRLTDWLLDAHRQGHPLPSLSDEHLLQARLTPLVTFKPQLATTVRRFLTASRML
ncbi:MAG: hypothetical protein IPL78_32355 [Chloroflexi bacterium]|nr:hypothetical protein [Chloroflexota bacterium]